MPTPLRTLPRNASGTLRKQLRCPAATKAASQPRIGGPIVSHAHPRGSSPTGS
jgi:hypothetical protein